MLGNMPSKHIFQIKNKYAKKRVGLDGITKSLPKKPYFAIMVGDWYTWMSQEVSKWVITPIYPIYK